jgi:hypothetical protein
MHSSTSCLAVAMVLCALLAMPVRHGILAQSIIRLDPDSEQVDPNRLTPHKWRWANEFAPCEPGDSASRKGIEIEELQMVDTTRGKSVLVRVQRWTTSLSTMVDSSVFAIPSLLLIWNRSHTAGINQGFEVGPRSIHWWISGPAVRRQSLELPVPAPAYSEHAITLLLSSLRFPYRTGLIVEFPVFRLVQSMDTAYLELRTDTARVIGSELVPEKPGRPSWVIEVNTSPPSRLWIDKAAGELLATEVSESEGICSIRSVRF